jgi:hypothetical protein
VVDRGRDEDAAGGGGGELSKNDADIIAVRKYISGKTTELFLVNGTADSSLPLSFPIETRKR